MKSVKSFWGYWVRHLPACLAFLVCCDAASAQNASRSVKEKPSIQVAMYYGMTGYESATSFVGAIGDQGKGLAEGLWHFYYPDGKLMMEGEFRKGHGIGKWKYLDQIGRAASFGSLAGIRKLKGAVWLTKDGDMRVELVKRPGGSAPIMYYRHFRGIKSILGNRGRKVLVNDYGCTNCISVFTVDLASLKKTNIGDRVIEDARTALGIGSGPVAVGEEFSPDDKSVLVVVGMDWMHMLPVDRQKVDEGVEISRYYSVSTTNGEEWRYIGKGKPARWWAKGPVLSPK